MKKLHSSMLLHIEKIFTKYYINLKPEDLFDILINAYSVLFLAGLYGIHIEILHLRV